MKRTGTPLLRSLRLAFSSSRAASGDLPPHLLFILTRNGLLRCCLQAPTAPGAAACACLSPARPARAAGCQRCPVPRHPALPRRQERSGKLNVGFLFGQLLPTPEPGIQLLSGVNPPRCAAFHGSGAALPPRPSPSAFCQCRLCPAARFGIVQADWNRREDGFAATAKTTAANDGVSSITRSAAQHRQAPGGAAGERLMETFTELSLQTEDFSKGTQTLTLEKKKKKEATCVWLIENILYQPSGREDAHSHR